MTYFQFMYKKIKKVTQLIKRTTPRATHTSVKNGKYNALHFSKKGGTTDIKQVD